MRRVVTVIFWLFVLLLLICLPATLVKYYDQGGSIFYIFFDVLKVLGVYFGIVAAATIPFVSISILIERALKNKNGNLFQVFEIINLLSVVFVGLIGLYFAIVGMSTMYRKNLALFLTIIVISVFIIYYHYKKKNPD